MCEVIDQIAQQDEARDKQVETQAHVKIRSASEQRLIDEPIFVRLNESQRSPIYSNRAGTVQDRTQTNTYPLKDSRETETEDESEDDSECHRELQTGREGRRSAAASYCDAIGGCGDFGEDGGE